VLRVSHRIAVLRGGRLVADLPAQGADKAMLAEAMVGRAVAPAVKRSRSRGAPAVELRGATLRGTGPRPLLDAAELTLHAGEVFAVAGVAGNGQEALADLLCGLHAPDAGTLMLGGRAIAATPRAFVAAGVARIPEDRHAVGVVGDLPLWENAVLERYATPAFASRGIVRRDRAMAHAKSLVERFDVRGTESAGMATTTRALSGGNMQKLILGRALSGDPDSPATPPLIVANQPTWGLDIGAVAYVHQQLLDACAAGSAVLLISEDLDEIFALADRIAVMHHGRLGAPRAAGDWTLAAIGLAMSGGEAGGEAAHAA
jgi:general nucleoside transport system ATP-binding protein